MWQIYAKTAQENAQWMKREKKKSVMPFMSTGFMFFFCSPSSWPPIITKLMHMTNQLHPITLYRCLCADRETLCS